MRKQTKVAVVVSAAALLAMGASMTSFAKGWTLEDNEWVWLDSDGERVYGEWKKSVDGNYYWLDEETGVMATDRLVEDDEDTYYVNSDGIRLTSAWKDVDNEDSEEINGTEVDTIWYYFGSNGKAYKADNDLVKKNIGNGTYFFDENGYMQNGWVSYTKDGKTNLYYCGTEDQGWAFKGWQYLETADVDHITQGEYEDEEWFYFDGGKMVANKTKYIDGHYYSFNADGIMETGWDDVNVASGADGIVASGSNTTVEHFILSNGVMKSGWVKAEKDDDTDWYYMVTVRDRGDNTYRAVPFNFNGDAVRAKYIDGKTYAFDTDGKMLTGLQELDGTDGTLASEANKNYDGVTGKYLESGIYYFSKESGANEGKMMTGKVTVTTDGVDSFYYFDKNGRAVKNQYRDGVIYDGNGERVQAEDGNSYDFYDVTTTLKNAKGQNAIDDTSKVIVSSTGKVRTSGSVRIDGEKYTVKKNGIHFWVVDEDGNTVQ